MLRLAGSRATSFLNTFENLSTSFQSYQLFLLKVQDRLNVKIGAV